MTFMLPKGPLNKVTAEGKREQIQEVGNGDQIGAKINHRLS